MILKIFIKYLGQQSWISTLSPGLGDFFGNTNRAHIWGSVEIHLVAICKYRSHYVFPHASCTSGTYTNLDDNFRFVCSALAVHSLGLTC